jgi:hypothetical protein
MCAVGNEVNNRGTRGRSGRWKGGNNERKGFFFLFPFYFGGGEQ